MRKNDLIRSLLLSATALSLQSLRAGNVPLQITSEPADAVVAVGSNISLTVQATGSPAPTYQWALNGEPIPGATSSTLTLQNIQTGDCGSYSAFIQNAYQTIQSDPASITVNVPILPFADKIGSRGVVKGSSGVGRGNNETATTDLLDPWGLLTPVTHSVWLSWTAPQSGVATFSTVGSGFDTVLGAFNVTTLPLLPSVYTQITSDDESGGYHTSQITFNVTGGKEYVIGVASYDMTGGDIMLSWQFTAGQSAPTILSQPASQTVNYGQSASLSISVQSLLPVLFQWFKNDVAIQGANSSILNVASVGAADVGIYHCQLSVLGLTLLSSDAELQINTEGLKAGARNKLSDAKLVGIKGSNVSAMSTHKIHAFDISGSAGYSGTQVFQTSPGMDPGEPQPCGVTGGSSYWLSYTAPASGVLTMNTDGSNFDTVMAVYIDNGSNQGYSSLVQVTCDNNSGSNGKTSRVVFNVTANQVYYIQIDGVSGATGTVYLNYSLNTPPTISAISAISTTANSSTTSRSFTVSDRETAAGSLIVGAYCSNSTLVPSGNISFSGTDGNRTINVQPAANQSGSATITVTVRDAGGLTSSTSFSVTVAAAANRPPVANNDSTSCRKGYSVSLYIPTLLSNDSDPDGDALSLYSYGCTSNLSGKITQSGNYLYYTPSSTVSVGSSDYFTYTITDGRGGYASARVFISITQ